MEVLNVFVAKAEMETHRSAAEEDGAELLFDEFFSAPTSAGEGLEIAVEGEDLTDRATENIEGEEKGAVDGGLFFGGIFLPDSTLEGDNETVSDGAKVTGGNSGGEQGTSVVEEKGRNETELAGIINSKNAETELATTSGKFSPEPEETVDEGKSSVKGQLGAESSLKDAAKSRISQNEGHELTGAGRIAARGADNSNEGFTEAGTGSLEKPQKGADAVSREVSSKSADESVDLKSLKTDSSRQGDAEGKHNGERDNYSGRNLFGAKSAAPEAGRSEGQVREPFRLTREVLPESQKGEGRVELARLSMNGHRGEVKMELNPPSLGKLQVELNLQHNGLKAVFHTDSPSVKGILDGNMQSLKDAMAGQGLNLESFDVLTGGDGRGKWDGESSDLSRWMEASSEEIVSDDEERVESERGEGLYPGREGVNIVV